MYTLQSNYILHILGNHKAFPLKPEILEILDILACKLEENKLTRCVELTLGEALPLTGYDVTKSSKNVVRLTLQESAALLRELRVDWTEKEGRYTYSNVKLFDEITYQNSRICARFSKEMAQYAQPSHPVPAPPSFRCQQKVSEWLPSRTALPAA